MTPYRNFEIAFISALVVLSEKHKKQTDNMVLADYVHFEHVSPTSKEKWNVCYWLSSDLDKYPFVCADIIRIIHQITDTDNYGCKLVGIKRITQPNKSQSGIIKRLSEKFGKKRRAGANQLLTADKS